MDAASKRLSEIVDLTTISLRMAMIANSPVHVNGGYLIDADAAS